jgi:hypothetical protein
VTAILEPIETKLEKDTHLEYLTIEVSSALKVRNPK